MTEVTFEKRSDRAMTDEGNGLAGIVGGEDGFDRFYNASLRVGCGLPAFVACMRVGEEPVSSLFEEVRWEKAGRASVVLVHVLNSFDVETAGAGKISRRFNGFGLGTADDTAKVASPGLREGPSGSFCPYIR